MSRIKNYFFVLLVIFSFSACSGGKTVHWKQEVLLQDGRVIIVERDSDQVGQILPERNVIERRQVIFFTNPDTSQKVEWELPAGLLPYTLDFDNKIPYLVLVAYGVGDYNRWNCPNPPYLVYRHDETNWSSIPIEQLPSRFEKRNLINLGKGYQKYATSEVASLSDMEKFLKARSPERRIISREKISSIAEGCNPDTLTKLGRQSEINYRR